MVKKRISAILLRLLAVLFMASCGVRAQCQIMSVSVPDLALGKGERIVGFEVHIRSGRIALLPNVPIGWNMSIDNNPSWNTVVKGSIEVGGAAADKDFLQDFIVIEKQPDAPSDAPFSLQGEVIVTSDFKSEKRIKLSMKDFAVRGAGATKTTTKPQ